VKKKIGSTSLGLRRHGEVLELLVDI
jgi:hypothetical protein